MTLRMFTPKSPSVSAACPTSYVDPNRDAGSHRRGKWLQRVIAAYSRLVHSRSAPDARNLKLETCKRKKKTGTNGIKIPATPGILLTERNLTELFNPHYCDEHDAFHRVRPSREVSVHEWLQRLP